METTSTWTFLNSPRPARCDGPVITSAFRLLCLLCLTIFAGCVTSPFSDSLRSAAKNQPTLDDIRAQPQAFKGRTVLMGGTIVQTTNLPKTTEIEVLQKPLDRYDDRPQDTDRSSGRFLIRCPGFLDSAIHAKGREITVAGPVEGMETRQLDQTEYTYPVIGCQEIHLWPNQPAVMYNYPPPYWYGPYWHGWGYYPYWYPYW